ncbi:MAG: DUF4926 domain-containing protein [Spirulinaceae cyanobacterium]
MKYELYTDVILQKNLPNEGLCIGDVGTVVEYHQVEGLDPGYSVEFFDMVGNTVAVVTLPESALRSPTTQDRPTVRPLNSTVGAVFEET